MRNFKELRKSAKLVERKQSAAPGEGAFYLSWEMIGKNNAIVGTHTGERSDHPGAKGEDVGKENYFHFMNVEFEDTPDVDEKHATYFEQATEFAIAISPQNQPKDGFEAAKEYMLERTGKGMSKAGNRFYKIEVKEV